MRRRASPNSTWRLELSEAAGVVKLDQWLRIATARLASVSDTPRLDAELLAAHALGLSRQELILAMPRLAAPGDSEQLIARRLANEPLAYITGTRDFWTLSLRVTPDVLIPRPDSETLIEAAIDFFGADRAPRRILDLGTGSGALLLAALDHWSEASGLGVDASPAALTVARENAQRCGLGERATMQTGNWGADIGERFDLLLCNPPYIAQDAVLAPDVRDHEPARALFAGADGLSDYRILARQLGALLAPDGVAIFEIGYDQAETAGALFREQSFEVVVKHDLAGHSRALIVTTC